MMKKILYTIFGCIISVMSVSCSNDLLDIEQRGVLAESAYFKTDEDATSSIATLYSLWKAEAFDGARNLGVLSPDIYNGGGIRNDNVAGEQLNEFRYTTDHGTLSSYFKRLYTMIYNANLILERYSDDTDEKLRVKAEAKFFRAYANFMLVTLWGTPYFVDHVLSASEYQLPNAESPAIFWTAIEADLKDAIASGKLPSKKSLDDPTTGLRLTKECAQAYLGKALLWEKKYDEAAAMLQQVIDSKKYGLVDDLSLLFHSAGDHCKEYLAEAESLNDPANSWMQGNMSGMYWGWKTSNSIVLNKNQDKWPYAIGGYGFINPTLTYVNLVRSVEGEEGKRFKNNFVTWDYMVSEYGATATRNHFYNEGWFETKLLLKKEDNFSYQGSSGWMIAHQNFPHMRYAEVLLMAAEAYLQAGDQAKALVYFNQVRKRANAPEAGSLSIDDILIERRIELWGESPVIFQDIQRYRLGEKLCGKQFAKYPVYTLIGEYASHPQIIWYDNGYEEYGFKEKHYLFPYSSSELRSNPNLKQNPGW